MLPPGSPLSDIAILSYGDRLLTVVWVHSAAGAGGVGQSGGLEVEEDPAPGYTYAGVPVYYDSFVAIGGGNKVPGHLKK